ncbi:MAG: ABC transporter ATP-binding protein, partial [Clostridia bacterium]|nr:ABC transporter ATP-binding protein [Clostridia bacterium]
MDNLNQPVVKVENVSFTYGCHPVLNNISLTVNQGDSVGLTGPNGAGKSTLLKLIAGQLRPQKGEISLMGHMAGCRKNRSSFSYLPQRATHFNPSFPASVREVVLSGLTASKGLFRLYSRSDRKRVEECLKMVGLKEKAREPLWSLSGGQQQRIFMARALMSQPRLVILYEPTVGLDMAAKEDLKDLLAELN